MTTLEFEELLTTLSGRLTKEVRASDRFHVPAKFERRVRAVLAELTEGIDGIKIDMDPHAQAFPDIIVGKFGIEVKVVHSDSWRTISNSVFEGSRDPKVKHVYVLFGKMGGTPEVKWGRYEACVMHVRTSHVPRFEVDITAKQSLFQKFGITYEEFCALSPHDKMKHVRKYAKSRLKKGERLWWLEDKPEREQEHSLPLEVLLYMNLDKSKKRQLRAEAALLCPQIVGPSRAGKKTRKYTDATIYLLTYHGVLCPQTRDLFSAGSVAGKERGGNYVARALKDIEAEMKNAAEYLEDALFLEYWGENVPRPKRIKEWLRRADRFAKDWKPSKALFHD
jgi:hypothetical protein